MIKNGNIILIGFMGSGKTTFGSWISKEKNMQFLDTDEYIVQQEKRTINDIFAQDGEEYFRNLETNAVKNLIGELKNCVISVGGGLPVREENRKLLKELGTVVYLNTSQKELVRRLSGDTTRPLLAGGEIEKKIENLMNAREALYIDASDVIISTENTTFDKMYKDIV